MSADLIRGHRYLITSQRKGTFVGELVCADDTWATFTVTAGKAKAMLAYNEADKGEEVTVRRALCVFAEQPADPIPSQQPNGEADAAPQAEQQASRSAS